MTSTLLAAERLRRLAKRLGMVVLVGTVAVAAGCSSDGPTTPKNDNPIGTYSLRQVGTEGLPSVVHHGPYFDAPNHHFYSQLVVEIDGGSIELGTGKRFIMMLNVTLTGDGQTAKASPQVTGRYEVNGSEIQFIADGGIPPGLGVIRGGTIGLGIDFLSEGKELQYSFKK